MERILIQQVNLAPNATAVVENDSEISYRELIARADVLVKLLEKEPFECEKPVCVLANSGVHQALAQIAVLRVGGTCASIDPTVPIDRLKLMLEDLATAHILCSQEFVGRFPSLDVMVIDAAMEDDVSLSLDSEALVHADRPESHRSHILFSSGSTGGFKPIQTLSSNILHALKNMPCGALGPSDRTTALLNPGFDLHILEIWKTLLEGATIVTVPRLTRTDPFAFQDFLAKEKITFTVLPTALFEVVALTAPGAFSGVRNVIIGGEAVTPNAVRSVLDSFPPNYLWNGYGPAEGTIFVTMAHVTPNEAQRSGIGIGSAFGENKIFLLDESLQSLPSPGQVGEICIAGPQLSPGYLNRPEKNKESFIEVHASTLGTTGDASIRLYRTGDLAQWRDKVGGELDFVGRGDDEVKISGYRVELAEVSRRIETHPKVLSCVVKHRRDDNVDYLEAYIIPKDWNDSPDSTSIVVWAERKLPPYMVPSKIFNKRSFPLSNNGKVNRKQLQPHDESVNESQINTQPQDEQTSRNHLLSNEESQSDEELSEWLKVVIQEMLDISDLKPSDNFFSLGLSSLQAARLIGRIRREKDRTIRLQQVHSHPTIERLEEILVTAPRGKYGKYSEVSDLERWGRDSRSPLNLTTLPDWQSPDEGRVFLTGATGFLGAHILQHLLRMSTVRQVACLVRSQPNASASSRIQNTLEKYKIWDGRLDEVQKIIVLDGDLADINLGLGEEKFTWLTNWASVIFHAGARVNWCEPYETHYEPNVVGTKNIIRAATLGRRKALHYVSSVDVWSVSGFINDIDRVYEDEPLMPHLNALPYDTGYAASQFVTEELVQRARAHGLPTVIHRPGFIIGHSEKAITNANDYFSRLIIGCIQTGYFPDLSTQYLEYVTVDYVTSAIMHIASSANSLGRSYHIVPPHRAQSANYNDIYQMLLSLGHSIQKVEYKEWVERVRQQPGNALDAMMPLIEETVYEDMTRLETSKNTPIYDSTNLKAILKARRDINYIPLTSHLLHRFIDQWVEQGEFEL